MKHNIIIAVALLIATAAMATPERQILSVTTGTNAATAVTTTSATLRGYIDTVTFDVITAGTTGTLWATVTPELSTLSVVDLARVEDCGADTVIRPRFDPTTVAGVTLTNDPPYTSYMYPVVGEVITFGVSNASATNITFKCIVKYDK